MKKEIGKRMNPHSNIIMIFLKYGIVGIILFIIFYLKLLSSAHRNISRIEGKLFFLLLLTLFIDGLVHTNYQDSIVLMFLSLVGLKLNNEDNTDQISVSVKRIQKKTAQLV